MPNENFLKGVKCPKCGSYGPFNMQACTYFEGVTDLGTTGEHSDDDFGVAMPFIVHCVKCEHEATYGEFLGYESWKCGNCGAGGKIIEICLNSDLDPVCSDCCSAEVEFLSKEPTLPYGEPCSCDEALWWKDKCEDLLEMLQGGLYNSPANVEIVCEVKAVLKKSKEVG